MQLPITSVNDSATRNSIIKPTLHNIPNTIIIYHDVDILLRQISVTFFSIVTFRKRKLIYTVTEIHSRVNNNQVGEYCSDSRQNHCASLGKIFKTALYVKHSPVNNVEPR